MMQDSMPRRADHILSYADHLRGGGVERALLRLAAGWLAAGRRVTLAIGDPAGPLAAELPPGANVVRAGLLPAVRAASPDLVFCPGNHYSARAAWLRLLLGGGCPPIVAKMSNAFERGDQGRLLAPSYRWWLARHPRFVDALVAMTPALADEARRLTGLDAARVSVIANPPARLLPGAALPPLPDGRFILGVGRLRPQKRWDRLIAALPRLADPNVALVILGEGPERDALERQVAALGLSARVRLPGHAVDPLPALARASVAALTSDFEGVPGVLREALSVGTPVVTTDSTVAIGEIVTSPSLGSIVPRDDAAALVAALDHWLAPGRPRPSPVPAPGNDAEARYLDLFDSLVAGRR